MMTIGILLQLMLLLAFYTVLTPTLLKAAIGLALTSVMLTFVMFQFDAPLAGVFELSVCAGLITVVFISAISLTKPEAATDEEGKDSQGRLKRFAALPLIVLVLGVLLWAFVPSQYELPPRELAGNDDVRAVLWNTRRFDLLGQIVAVLAGVFGVVVLFKNRGKEKQNNE
jgi:NADH-quinone oxidoreductase subunit J